MKRVNIPEYIRQLLELGVVITATLGDDEIQEQFYKECLIWHGKTTHTEERWPPSWLEDVEEDGKVYCAECERQNECGWAYGHGDAANRCKEWKSQNEPQETHTLTPDELTRVRVDAPVEVSVCYGSFIGHFAGLMGEYATVWEDGKTSFTGGSKTTQKIRIPETHNPATWRAENLEPVK